MPRSKKGDDKKRTGVCGATIDTVVARNFARKIAAGTASHSDHAREVAETFLKTAKGEAQGFAIKDEVKLLEVALDFGVPIEGRDAKEIAIDVGEKALAEFGRQHGEAAYIKKAPLKRQEIWRKHGVVPRGIDREVVEVMHRTHMGVDQDYKHLMLQATRCALADGWSGSMISTDLQDIMFGTPVPVLGTFNLGVLKEDQVNVVVHGHEPLLPELLVTASRDPEIKQMAEKAGAKGINLAGMCCSANEVLMRHGIPCAGNFLQQELALVTGAVEVMTVDVQCEMQGLADVAECFHTKLITTSDRAKIEGAEHIEFHPETGLDTAKKILKMAIENYPNRRHNVAIPQYSQDGVVGFSHETINYLLGGLFRASYKPLNDNIINGRIRGVAGVVGCNNARTPHDQGHLEMVKELLRNDVIVLSTGCSAMACGKAGLAHARSRQDLCGLGPRGGLRDGRHPPCPSHGVLRGQLAHPHRGNGHGKRGWSGRRHLRPARGRRRPRMDEREGAVHRPVLRRFRRLHRLWHHVAHLRLGCPDKAPLRRTRGDVQGHVGLRAGPRKGGFTHDRPHRQEEKGPGAREGQGKGTLRYGHEKGLGVRALRALKQL